MSNARSLSVATPVTADFSETPLAFLTF